MRAGALEQVKVTFRNENNDGVLEDMDVLPSAFLYVDGALDSSVVVAVSRISTGTYKAVWTMGNYSVNDIWELVVNGSYDGTTYSRIVKEGYIGEATFLGSSRFTRLEAYLNETPTMSWLVGNYTLDNRVLRLQVGEGSYEESPPIGDILYTFPDIDITRLSNLVTITIPIIITANIKTYPWTLRDITTGDSELQSGVIDVLYDAN